eukprot:5808279-Ditylum_brightwellii.AAC.2
MEKLGDMIIRESKSKNVKQIFKEKPSMCFNNYFSHASTSDLAGKEGYSLIYTVNHECLPKVFLPSICAKKGQRITASLQGVHDLINQ